MRTFNVNVKGAIHVVRAEDFLRPTESVNGRWCFLSAKGRVLWSWPTEDVRSVVEVIRGEVTL